VLLLFSLATHARQLEVPLQLEQGFMQRLLVEQVYTETNGEAQVWDDGKNCNQLTLSSPELGFENSQVKTRTAAHVRIGTALGDYCLSLVNWDGYIEIYQKPFLGSKPGVIEFKVVDSRVLLEDGESKGVFGTLWNLIKDYAHPRFDRMQLDLSPVLNELRGLLELVFPPGADEPARVLDTASFTSVDITDDRIDLSIRFEIPESTVKVVPVDPEPALTHEELARWEESWQRWDAFLTLVIKHAGADTELTDLRTALFAVLLDARQDMLEILVPSITDEPDPVPELFVKTWEQLAPVLNQLSETLPTSSVINYLTFITASNALVAIETAGEDTGFVLSADALRRMARMIAPLYASDPLHYDTEVDPELRSLFGFGPPLPPPETDTAPLETEDTEQLPYLPDQSFLPNRQIQVVGIPSALFMPVMIVTDSAYTMLVNRLNGVVPSIKVLNEYLPQMQLLLDLVAQSTLHEKKLDAPYAEIYRPLVLATAWQESCWRQYIKVKGEIQPIRSHAGAVGIMQVNQHVWRGFYDVNGLQHDVGYNAVAGSEILHHYLHDYAIAKGEQNQDGGIDNLVRATYAMYNGGPRHINRYRRENTSAPLRAIDNSFWKKYQSVRAGHTMAVSECYTG
jgi:hypothetical protein